MVVSFWLRTDSQAKFLTIQAQNGKNILMHFGTAILKIWIPICILGIFLDIAVITKDS